MQADIIQHLSQDTHLKKIMDEVGLITLTHNTQVFESLVRAIVYQQLNGKAAGTIHRRFLDLYEPPHPLPRDIMKTEIEQMRAVGLSRQKATYIHNIAEFFHSSSRSEEEWNEMENESILAELTSIKGVGEWTVQMLLMFTLGREDVLPVKDYGIQQAMIGLYGIEGKGRKLHKAMEVIAEPWRPYRTYACWLLWRWKDDRDG